MDSEAMTALAGRLTRVPGVVGVMLGGSRARGEHVRDSDVDLGLYYRPPLDVPALGRLARDVSGPDARVTEPGEWGPWVDGGGWLSIDGGPVDWIYRNLNRVHAAWVDTQAGRFAFHGQVGHPLGVPDFAYPGEVALGVVLADPTGELRQLQEQTRRYPPLLRKAVIRRTLWEAGFSIRIARKASGRGDTTYVAGCLFRAATLCAHALFAFAGRWLISEKGAVAAAGRLPGAPDDFAQLAHALLASLGTTEASLDAALAVAEDLVVSTEAACRDLG